MKFAPDKRKYPITPIGIHERKERANKSKSLSIGIFLNLKAKNKNILVPKTPPTSDKPGKYGKSRKYKGFRKLPEGLVITNKSLENKRDKGTMTKAILKRESKDTSFLRRIKSSRERKCSAKRNIK